MRVKDDANETGHDALPKIFVKRVGFKHNEIMHTTTSYRLAKIIATIFNHDEDVCDMHDCDNMGR